MTSMGIQPSKTCVPSNPCTIGLFGGQQRVIKRLVFLTGSSGS